MFMENQNESGAERRSDIESGKITTEREADVAVLNELYRNAGLAMTSIEKLLPKCEDETFKYALLKAFGEFDAFAGKVSRKITALGYTPKSNNAMKTTMMKTSIAMSTMMDSSPQKMADMLTQGYNMGIIDVNKILNGYRGTISDDVADLCVELLDIEQHGLDGMKKYL